MLSANERLTFSHAIFKKLLNLKEYQTAKTIMVYVAFGSEVITDEILKKILDDKKILLLPKVLPKTKTIQALQVNNLKKDLEVGFAKITEPKKDCSEIENNQIDLIIIPGVAFGKNGARLGYGKGYYDRFLKKCRGKIVGIAFETQITDKIILEKHDVLVDIILTEKQFIECHQYR